MHPGTAAVMPRTSGALLFPPMKRTPPSSGAGRSLRTTSERLETASTRARSGRSASVIADVVALAIARRETRDATPKSAGCLLRHGDSLVRTSGSAVHQFV
jgi:hypothetical protein